MIEIKITADSISELKAKIFSFLEMDMDKVTGPAFNPHAVEILKKATPTQTTAEPVAQKTVSAPLSGLSNGSSQKRTRRTKAEMEALKNKAVDSVVMSEDVEVEEVVEELSLTHADCKNALAKVIKEKSMADAIKIIKAFGVKQVPELKPEQFAKFINAANEALST